jgi:hypothetical protein
MATKRRTTLKLPADIARILEIIVMESEMHPNPATGTWERHPDQPALWPRLPQWRWITNEARRVLKYPTLPTTARVP